MAQEDFKSYKPSHKTEEVVALTEQVLGNHVNKIERKNVGEVNAVYFVDIADGRNVVVKISPSERGSNNFQQEATAFSLVRNMGVPVPNVIAIDTSGATFAESYMITERIDGVAGHDAWSDETEGVALTRELGHYLSLIHKVKLKGFGRELTVEDGNLTGQYSSQWEAVTTDLDAPWRHDALVKPGILTQEKVDAYRKLFEDNRRLFDIPQASLLHGDISLNNVLVKDLKIVGIVDMENCLAGDPVQEFAYHHFWIEGAEPYFSAMKDGYDNKSIFDENFMKKIYLYELYIGQGILGYYQSRGNSGAMDAVKRRLDAAEKNLLAI